MNKTKKEPRFFAELPDASIYDLAPNPAPPPPAAAPRGVPESE